MLVQAVDQDIGPLVVAQAEVDEAGVGGCSEGEALGIGGVGGRTGHLGAAVLEQAL